ncbi:MAG: undecaprenyldiphospho-muramoylpentapeptide beta-N-acetylglucosaminyltransferase [Bdellovibrionales bacterium]|nr:undecaprenyldiphospho-muramoylpentapeptide beta-N-acetylglucosaminyltransferase [Oligoflexia bacterium]
MKQNRRLLVAGGGTGGHVLAGIAIADEWMKQLTEAGSEKPEVLFVGSAKGLEARLVPKYGYPLKLLKIGALNKVGFKTRLSTSFQLPMSFLKAFFILVAYRPHAVIGVGGYSSGPVVMVARLLAPIFRITTSIIEQNSVAGFTNRLLGRQVDKVFCAFQAGVKSFDAKKVTVTGNPIRSSLKKLPVSKSEPFTLFIFGGSQGAQGINNLLLEALPFLKTEQIQFIHQTGDRDFERVQAGYMREGLGSSRIERFIDDMSTCYEMASLVVCRAGASTLAELASVGRAAIFIPLPTAADNHQEKNARIFEEENAAWVVPQGSLTGAQFAEMILKLKADPGLVHEVETRVQKFYQSDSAFQIVKGLRA